LGLRGDWMAVKVDDTGANRWPAWSGGLLWGFRRQAL